MIIYKITNSVNDKIYIGMTIQNPENRWRDHLSKSKTFDYPLYKAIRKHGSDKFKFEVIDTASSLDELKQKEVYWINYYNSYLKGYNATVGGDGRKKWNDENEKLIVDHTKNGLSASQISKLIGIPERTIQKILKRLDIKSSHHRDYSSKYDLVKELTMEGYTQLEIADQLNMPHQTVSNIKRKLGIRTYSHWIYGIDYNEIWQSVLKSHYCI